MSIFLGYDMLSSHRNLVYSLVASSLLFNCSQIYGDSPSTWTGTDSSDMRISGNWNNGVPSSGVAVFNGDGANSPLSRRDSGLNLSEMQFTAPTQVTIITGITTSGANGVNATSGTTAVFDILEHQPLVDPPATLTISNGPAGAGGGTVEYNLEAYGQLYAHAGSTGSTIVNVTMTGGHNHFELTNAGSHVFNDVSSNDGFETASPD